MHIPPNNNELVTELLHSSLRGNGTSLSVHGGLGSPEEISLGVFSSGYACTHEAKANELEEALENLR